jgi:hypothetical protein
MSAGDNAEGNFLPFSWIFKANLQDATWFQSDIEWHCSVGFQTSLTYRLEAVNKDASFGANPIG